MIKIIKHSPSWHLLGKNRDLSYNIFGEKPKIQKTFRFTEDMFDGFDKNGFDMYGYSSFSREGKFLGCGQGIDMFGFTDMEYVNIGLESFEKFFGTQNFNPLDILKKNLNKKIIDVFYGIITYTTSIEEIDDDNIKHKILGIDLTDGTNRFYLKSKDILNDVTKNNVISIILLNVSSPVRLSAAADENSCYILNVADKNCCSIYYNGIHLYRNEYLIQKPSRLVWGIQDYGIKLYDCGNELNWFAKNIKCNSLNLGVYSAIITIHENIDNLDLKDYKDYLDSTNFIFHKLFELDYINQFS